MIVSTFSNFVKIGQVLMILH